MPLSKKKTASNVKRKTDSGPKGIALAKIPDFALYSLAVLLVVGGQVLILKGSHPAGMFLSLLGVLVFGLVYLGLLDFSKMQFHLSLSSPRPLHTPSHTQTKPN